MSNQKRHLYSRVHCSIAYNSQDMKSTYASIKDESIKKMCHTHIYIYTHNELLFNLKKEGSFVICNSMNEPERLCIRCSKPGTERRIPYDLTHMWNLEQFFQKMFEMWISSFLGFSDFIIHISKHHFGQEGCLCFGGAGVWTQSFTRATQALYCLSHTSSLFYYGYFGYGVSQTICPGCPWTTIG
jgi:hypothetical protein